MQVYYVFTRFCPCHALPSGQHAQQQAGRRSSGVKLRADRTLLQREFPGGGSSEPIVPPAGKAGAAAFTRSQAGRLRPAARLGSARLGSASPPRHGRKMPGMGSSLRAAALLAFVVLSILVSLLISSVQQFGARVTHFPNASVPGDAEELAALRGVLISQLRQRRGEILPLLSPDEDGGPTGQWLSAEFPLQQDAALDPLDQRLWTEITLGSRRAHLDDMDCASLVDMQALEVLGSGYTKLVVKVQLAGGQPVALKLVNEQGIDMGRCLEDFRDPRGCRELVSYKLKKEIVLLQRLKHPNVIQLKGHCAGGAGGPGGRGGEGGRVTVILEQGDPLQMIQLLQSPWEDRFRVCLDLARLLHFLSRSPLGSVALLDFQPRQFVTVSGSLKLTDLDDASAAQTACVADADCTLRFPHRNFSLPCSARGVCEGLNEKRNIYNAYRYFFTYLLPHQAPAGLTHLVDHIMNSTGELKADINETLQAFEHVLLLYQSGLHLDNLPPSVLRDYTLTRGMATWGDVDYRCWPSHSQQGCVLSVHGAQEAAHICNSHSQCGSFTLNGRKTWTGRFLASFRSSFARLAPDGTSDVYVKKSKALEASTV